MRWRSCYSLHDYPTKKRRKHHDSRDFGIGVVFIVKGEDLILASARLMLPRLSNRTFDPPKLVRTRKWCCSNARWPLASQYCTERHTVFVADIHRAIRALP